MHKIESITRIYKLPITMKELYNESIRIGKAHKKLKLVFHIECGPGKDDIILVGKVTD